MAGKPGSAGNTQRWSAAAGHSELRHQCHQHRVRQTSQRRQQVGRRPDRAVLLGPECTDHGAHYFAVFGAVLFVWSSPKRFGDARGSGQGRRLNRCCTALATAASLRLSVNLHSELSRVSDGLHRGSEDPPLPRVRTGFLRRLLAKAEAGAGARLGTRPRPRLRLLLHQTRER